MERGASFPDAKAQRKCLSVFPVKDKPLESSRLAHRLQKGCFGSFIVSLRTFFSLWGTGEFVKGAGGRERTGGNGLCGYTPGSGSRRKLGQRKRTGEAPGMLRNFLSTPHLASGTPSVVPLPMAVLASLLNHWRGVRRQGEAVSILSVAP